MRAGGNGAAAGEGDRIPLFARFVLVTPGNCKQQGVSGVSYNLGGMRQKEVSKLLSLAAALLPAWERFLAWMKLLLILAEAAFTSLECRDLSQWSRHPWGLWAQLKRVQTQMQACIRSHTGVHPTPLQRSSHAWVRDRIGFRLLGLVRCQTMDPGSCGGWKGLGYCSGVHCWPGASEVLLRAKQEIRR